MEGTSVVCSQGRTAQRTRRWRKPLKSADATARTGSRRRRTGRRRDRTEDLGGRPAGAEEPPREPGLRKRSGCRGNGIGQPMSDRYPIERLIREGQQDRPRGGPRERLERSAGKSTSNGSRESGGAGVLRTGGACDRGDPVGRPVSIPSGARRNRRRGNPAARGRTARCHDAPGNRERVVESTAAREKHPGRRDRSGPGHRGKRKRTRRPRPSRANAVTVICLQRCRSERSEPPLRERQRRTAGGEQATAMWYGCRRGEAFEG